MVLVTDAISAMGLEDGVVHQFGNKCVEIKKDAQESSIRSAYIQGTNILCGSVATMDECVKNLIKGTGCTIVEALECSSEHPAKMLGIYPVKGSLNFGADADFVIIDDNINIYSTFINGDMVWSKPDWSPLFQFKFIP